MASLNRATVLGNLGGDPEAKTIPSGDTVCSFSVATTESWFDKEANVKKEITDWHRIVVWGKTAEACVKYLKKGSRVYVEGKLKTRSWEKDGQKHYATEIKADNVQFLSSVQDGQGRGSAAPAPSSQRAPTSTAVDDIPF